MLGNLSWRHKAFITKWIGNLPYNEHIYRFIQKRFGRLKADPMIKMAIQKHMLCKLRNAGCNIDGKTILEVGTGAEMIVPVGFFLSGVKKCITVDLYEKVDYLLFRESLEILASAKDDLVGLYEGLVGRAEILERLETIELLKTEPKAFLREANIEYVSPADAGDLHLPDACVDIHLSVNVFEHIPKEIIQKILKEARRVLTDQGLLLHFIDMSDHFAHIDSSISKINFCRFSEQEWLRIAGNKFAYCNRLRACDYTNLIDETGFEVVELERIVDRASVQLIKTGEFPLHEAFAHYDVQDLCGSGLNILARAGGESKL